VPFITDEILAQLAAAAKANGLDLGLAPDGSEIGDLKPVIAAVNLNRAPSEIAHDTGMNLKDSGLYVYNGRLITVTPEGEAEDMDVDLFRSWVDQFQVNFYKRRMIGEGDEKKLGPPIKAMLKKDVANVILRSHDFRGHLPEIKRILPVRLPVWEKDEDGERRIRLLPYGYDQATMIYTQNTGVEYLEMGTLEDAVQYLRNMIKDFPYGDEGRSVAVQIAGMLTTYCQLLFAPLDRWPMIYFNANQPGSGKSRLAELMIYPIYGMADPLTYSDNDEFVKKLDTWSQVGVAYTFLDDVSGLVKNNDLNRWLTSPTWAIRVMHSQKKLSVVNQTLTLLTGNQATLSDDLTRRSLMVDLWSSELPADRQGRLTNVIDAEWLAAAKNRGDILSALFALVNHWSEKHAAISYTKLIPSFEGWSRIIPSIVTLAGFDCPLQEPNVQDAGGKQHVEFLRLMTAAVVEYEPQLGKPKDILLTEWCAMARRAGLFHGVISDMETTREVMDSMPKLYKKVFDAQGVERQCFDTDKDYQAMRYMDKGQSTKFGGILHKVYRGAIRTINGKRYQFADRQARHSTFALEMLKDNDSDPEPTEETPVAPAPESPAPVEQVEPVIDQEPGDDEKSPF
jgi:hypothetical protein